MFSDNNIFNNNNRGGGSNTAGGSNAAGGGGGNGGGSATQGSQTAVSPSVNPIAQMALANLKRDQEKKKIEEAGPVADLAQAAGRRDEGGNGATDVEDAAVLSSDVVDYNKLAPSIQTAVDQYGRERVREELLKTFVKASSIEAAIDQYGRERVREELMETIAEAPSIQTVVDQYGRERVREELMETFVKEFFMQTGPGGDPGGSDNNPKASDNNSDGSDNNSGGSDNIPAELVLVMEEEDQEPTLGSLTFEEFFAEVEGGDFLASFQPEIPLWDKPPPTLTRKQKSVRSRQLSGLGPLQARTSTDPTLAGFVCSSDGVSIPAAQGYIFFDSNVMGTSGVGSGISCVWLLDFPETVPDGTVVGINVKRFASKSPATLTAFSGTQACMEQGDSKFLELHIGGQGLTSVRSVRELYAFVPVADSSIVVQFDIQFEQTEENVVDTSGFELDLTYSSMQQRPRLAEGDKGRRSLLEDEAELREDGVLSGWMTLYGSNETSFRGIESKSGLIAAMTGTEKGVFIINNQDFESLDGIQRIKMIEDGPIVISNNPRLRMPVAEIIDWLNGVDGNISSIDLSFNDLYGQIPESYCDLLERVPELDLSQNINLCGAVPTCMEVVEAAVLGGGGRIKSAFESSEMQKFALLWTGTSVGSPCDAIEREGRRPVESFDGEALPDGSLRATCSPLGYMAKLEDRGEIVFDSLSVDLQDFKATSCAWESAIGESRSSRNGSVLVLHFDDFYTSINGGHGLCNDFSSGHNFYNPLLNGPLMDELTVSVFNDTYKRGLDVFRASGSELPAPFVLDIDPSYKSVQLNLVKTATAGMSSVDLAGSMNWTIPQCGGTSLKYAFVEPISTLEDLTSFVTKYRNTVTGEVDRSIVVASCNATGNGTKIEDLSALESVTKIKGDLIVMNCPTLRSFAGAEKLLNVTDSVMVQMNSGLKSIKGFTSLRSVGGSLVLEGNKKLRNLTGLGNLTQIGGSLLLSRTGLRSFRGLEGLEDIGGRLSIVSNSYISDMDGLNLLSRVGASMVVKYNQMLKSFSGLGKLTQIGGSMDIQLNQKLFNLTGLEHLISMEGSFALFNNPAMENMDQLESLLRVGGSFVVGSNEDLVSIQLPAVKSIGSQTSVALHATPDRRKLLDYENVSDESYNHIFAVEYNTKLRDLNISDDIEGLPWNFYVGNNQYLSGWIPWDLLTKGSVRMASLAYNNFSGPVDPYLCESTVEKITLNGNKDVCGSVPEDCPMDIVAANTNLRKPCKDIVAPTCILESQDEQQCTVIAPEHSSHPKEITFTFPKYELEDGLPESFNASIEYQFAVGTHPEKANVNPFTRIEEINNTGPNGTFMSYTWNVEDRHISLISGLTYYVLVNAYDLTGATAKNIVSGGTMIDVMPPDVTDAKVELNVDEDGPYRIKWRGYESKSGISNYKVSLLRDGKVVNTTSVMGDTMSLDGILDGIKNGTIFSAEVVAESMAGLESPKVMSVAVVPIPDSGLKNDRILVGVGVGVALGCLTTAGIISFFVLRHLKRQREKEKEERWLRKLNSSVFTYLQGTGTQAHKLASDQGSESLSDSHSFDADRHKNRVFIFTDIQSSTELCEQDADAYLLLQEAHDEIMRNALAEIGGHEVDTEGDAFQCMFPNVVISLLFCFKVQEDLAGYDWPESVLSLYGCARVKSKLYRNKYVWAGPRVRMAVHFAKGGTYLAKSHPTTRRVAYGGKAWDTTSTLSDVGHGGQIIVSESAWRQLTANGDEGAAGYPIFEDLGRYQIGDQGLPMRLLQVTPARSALSEREFPALRDVDMLDRGQGMNIVPSMDGKVAVVCAIIEPSRFIGVAERFITLIAKREQASKDFSMDDDSNDDIDAHLSSSLPYVPEYRNQIILSEKKKLARSLSAKRLIGSLDHSADSKPVYFTDEHQQAVDVVVSTLQSLVSQFGGYVIQTVEEFDVPQQMMAIAFKTPSSAVRFTLAAQTTLMEYPWPKEVNEAFGRTTMCFSKDGVPLYNGPCVAMSAHVTKIEKFPMFECEGRSKSSVGHSISYKYNGILQALELAFIANGGQTVLSSSFFDSKWQRGLSLSQTQVTDLGAHGVRYFSHPVKLIEILPKILQERTDFFSPLASQRILSVGAPNAPGAHGEPVALVFTYPRVAQEFQNSEHASQAVDNFSETVRILLPRYNGYESQEVGTGCFFLSFPSVDDAVAWSIHLQLILRRSDWNSTEKAFESRDCPEKQNLSRKSSSKSDSVDSKMGDYWGPLGSSSFSWMEGQVQESNADFSIVSSDSFGSDQNLTLRNMTIRKRHLVLVQIGISYGMPTKVTPHVQTGRADYFGPIVNLSARVAKGTKPGDVHLSSYEDLSETLRFGDDPDQQSCYLKGMEFANEGKWVDVDLSDEGMRSFKGVKDERRVWSIKPILQQ